MLFEADDHDAAEGWSMMVKGMARSLHTAEEIEDAEQAQLLPWTATVKEHYVRVLPTKVTGRRFQFGSEPDREFTDRLSGTDRRASGFGDAIPGNRQSEEPRDCVPRL